MKPQWYLRVLSKKSETIRQPLHNTAAPKKGEPKHPQFPHGFFFSSKKKSIFSLYRPSCLLLKRLSIVLCNGNIERLRENKRG